VTFDIRPAYRDVSGIVRLERTFAYEFAGSGRITITDEAEFSTPMTYESALIGFGEISKQPDGILRTNYAGSAVRIGIFSTSSIECSKQSFKN
jgi:hypothetical protein